MGLAVERPETPPFQLWPENQLPVALFRDLLTQWTVVPAGVLGLRYEALPVVMQMHGVPQAEQMVCFQALRVMEAAALAIFNRTK